MKDIIRKILRGNPINPNLQKVIDRYIPTQCSLHTDPAGNESIAYGEHHIYRLRDADRMNQLVGKLSLDIMDDLGLSYDGKIRDYLEKYFQNRKNIDKLPRTYDNPI